MSDAILPKSRTEVDRESFTRDENNRVARRVTDEVMSGKLDRIIYLLEKLVSGDLLRDQNELSLQDQFGDDLTGSV